MNKYIFLIAMVFSINVSAQYRVIDGDTIDTGIKPFENLKSVHLRLNGIDTPELHGKCLKEKQLAKEAKAFLQHTIDVNKDVSITFMSWDKYGGRVVGDLLVHDVSMSEEMIRRGYAVKYDGGKKTKNWCN